METNDKTTAMPTLTLDPFGAQGGGTTDRSCGTRQNLR